ncbi:MAG: 3,4-dehydroadipyl-CoA semialdehyde dehydrogenase [Alphaproteobacteria bacterium]|jgi:3,4-dehydroadipyl-CoA semialdehyde dehydrogenase|nr:3,4-dehydroadipyl-CoA semialdehyde dehydrogenase [Alphaproteobacteria bacterium]
MSSAPENLDSYLAGRWLRGSGVETELVDPVTGDVLATVSAKGLDFKAALDFARTRGQAALRALSFAERGKLLSAVADVLIANRPRYEAIAVANSGNTKIDAAIDIDGGIGTLKYYARLGSGLGDARQLLDEKPIRLAKAENYQAIHLLVPRRGVAVHINAFNFPSWGLWEKAAVSLLSGIPFLAKPASATALLAHAMVRDVVTANVLPEGAISLLCGGAGDLLSQLTGDDVIAFTGSADTAARIRGDANVIARGVPINIEADSINAALLTPDAQPGSPAFDAFVREVIREMTVKAGQKCTAIRRVFVPAGQADAVSETLKSKLAAIVVGDPRREDVRMGPVVSRGQQAAAFEGIRRLAGETSVVYGGAETPKLDGIDPAKSAFISPTLLRAKEGSTAQAVHEVEIFGPAATIVPYRNEEEASSLIARGGGSLVASIFGEDKAALARLVGAIAPSHGRVLAVDPAIATTHTGHGIVMPQCNHGGPGRAGNGAELGGLYGLRFYHQRVAVQGSSDLLASLQSGTASLNG